MTTITTDDVQRLVSRAIERPMSIQDAIRFCESVMSDVEGMLDALRSDAEHDEAE